MKKFYNQQIAPKLENEYLDDELLQYYTYVFINDKEILKLIYPDLVTFGEKCSKVYPEFAQEAERNKPILEKYDAWGNEINVIHTTNAWKYFKDEACLESLVSIPHNFDKRFSRIYQFVKLYLYAPSAGLFACPLSMTDGAAFLIKHIEKNHPDLLSYEMKEAFNSILTNNPKRFWTSGQWMTEILGGSDVRDSTQTTAELLDEATKTYKLTGLKWFTSAIDSEITFTLAKIKNENGDVDKTPTLFFLKIRDNKGKLNNIEIVRLKEKLGTKQLPTAELFLDGTIAQRASPIGKGIQFIMNLANITRLHNVSSSVGYMRRMLSLLKDYSYKRKVFGVALEKQPLHIIAFSRMKFLFEGNLVLLFALSKMQGKSENIDNYPQKGFLRFLLPLAKLFAGRSSEEIGLEGIQGFGAVGYMENSHIPNILRDTIVTSIWEGTINLLSFDFAKVIKSDMKGYEKLINKIKKNLEHLTNHLGFKDVINRYQNTLNEVFSIVSDVKVLSEIGNARDLSFLFTSLYILGLLAKYRLSGKILKTVSDILKDNNIDPLRGTKELFNYWIARIETYLINLKNAHTSDLKENQKYSFSKNVELKPKF